MSETQTEASTRIAEIVSKNDVVLFMKGTPLFPQCGFSSRAIAILDRLEAKYETVEDGDGAAREAALREQCSPLHEKDDIVALHDVCNP